VNIENTLKKLALSYLSKYDSTRKNLEMILKKKIFRMKETSKKEKFLFYDSIKKILDEFESKKIINDENFAEIKIKNLSSNGKSKYFIENLLLKKGVEKKLIKELIKKFDEINPDWEIESALLFAKKKKLGKSDLLEKKNKDLAKMARAGFNYEISIKVLEKIL
tara:strand:+ start:848 stop:1339 length:492 start_codon:yes stop_codon:yes gene_type:complete